jgi:hypothetical protein
MVCRSFLDEKRLNSPGHEGNANLNHFKIPLFLFEWLSQRKEANVYTVFKCKNETH